ncbi:hypothetical protein [Coleofasciculus sp. H7-2]|uniref:hypothetical protein n=1 Tax=Coleofasciculus sp. H7-2 TaxID=3351545 RepID=UPI0036734900
MSSVAAIVEDLQLSRLYGISGAGAWVDDSTSKLDNFSLNLALVLPYREVCTYIK